MLPPARAKRALLQPEPSPLHIGAEILALRHGVWTQSLAEFLEWEKIFGDDEIRHTRGSVDGGGQHHGRRIVFMWRNGDGLGFGRRRNIHEFENPAALSLAIFFIWTYPANQATDKWATIPANWEQLRWQWEYSHAANALMTFVAFCSVTLSALATRE